MTAHLVPPFGGPSNEITHFRLPLEVPFNHQTKAKFALLILKPFNRSYTWKRVASEWYTDHLPFPLGRLSLKNLSKARLETKD